MNYITKNKIIAEKIKHNNSYIIRDADALIHHGMVFEYWGKFEGFYRVDIRMLNNGEFKKITQHKFKKMNEVITFLSRK